MATQMTRQHVADGSPGELGFATDNLRNLVAACLDHVSSWLRTTGPIEHTPAPTRDPEPSVPRLMTRDDLLGRRRNVSA